MDHLEMMRNVSRTFALSIEQLPAPLCDAVAVAYLLFRVADCLEDHDTLPSRRKADLLRLWALVVRGTRPAEALTGQITDLDEGDPEIYVARHADFVIARMQALPWKPREILTEHVAETSLGMARWQDHGPFVDTEEEMDDYMHQVAGRVGYLLTEVFSWYAPSIEKHRQTLMPLGREFGLALQTVNIIRGMRKDYERGWVFVPAAFYEKAGLARDTLFDPARVEAAMAVVEMLACKAERHLSRGLAYIKKLPRSQNRIRLFCIWPLLFAVKTLALSRNNPLVLSSEAKMSRRQVKQIVFCSSLLSRSNTLTTLYFNLLSKT